MNVEMIAVKLRPDIASKGRGFVDPENGRAIAVGHQKRKGFQLVPNTSFIRARLHEGSLLKVELPPSTASAGSASSPTGSAAVIFTKKYSMGEQKFSKGDRLQTTAEEADLLVMEGVAKLVSEADAP